MRIKELGVRAFAEPWPETRRNLLYAGGLKDAPQTRLAFSDANHCDLTRMAARAAMSAARAFRRDFSIPAVIGCVPPNTHSAIRLMSSSVVTAYVTSARLRRVAAADGVRGRGLLGAPERARAPAAAAADGPDARPARARGAARAARADRRRGGRGPCGNQIAGAPCHRSSTQVAVPGAARQRGRAILARLALKLRAVSGLRDVALDLPGEPAPAPAAGAALADFRRRVAAAAAQAAPSQADADAEARRRAKEAKRERNRRIRAEKERRARKKAAKEAKRAAAAAAAS